MFKKGFALAAVAAFLAFSPAPASAAKSSWSGATTVVILYAGDTTLIQFKKMMNPEGCTSGNWIKLNTGTPDANAAYQLLLAAYLSGRTVQYRVDGCSSYPVIHSVQAQ